ncbi:glutamate--cysteine ligase [Nocardioides sp.]|uniref:carboxylate-amine ligase n=1 Tax=Nocardioides sp. TaxID=35761 RepID=UPI002C392061|nr:glutamate--cysteine ligase [Nocardioides sp.]HXH77369.1 glutamate--cysteine ligase [Nocardioides sp.]
MSRTLGIEEELLLVERGSGQPLSVAGGVMRRASLPEQRREAGLPAQEDQGPGGHVTPEMQQQQIETDTPPRTSLADLEQDLASWRELVIRSARDSGALVLAVGTSPMAVTPTLQRDERYARMADQYGLTAAEHLISGCHVHVSVESDDEGVGVLDRIRVWLPVLLALSANSPYWQGEDSGYASFRSQVAVRWPSAGPVDAFGSAERYHELVADMVATGVLLDPAMAYFDARLSDSYPTVEVRVADVCLDSRDAVLVAGLCRGLVETASRDWTEGRPAPEMPTAMLRLANWQAGRYGVEGDLLDPVTTRPRPAREVLDDLVAHVRPALEETGDLDRVREGIERVLTTGNGAARQRSVLDRTGQLTDVVAELARVTAGRGD